MDVAALRADTPGTELVIHFNNAGAALPPAPVTKAMVEHLAREGTIGGYEAAAEAAHRSGAIYASAARLLNGHPDEIALTDSATRAWDLAFYSLTLEPGDRVITTPSAYAANYIAFLQRSRRDGIEIVVAPNDGAGQADPVAVAEAMDDRVRLIALTHVSTNNGAVNPAQEIGGVAREWGVPYLLDACQSVGQLPVDVSQIGCTMLSTTGRKWLRGPRGTGVLWVDRDWLNRLDPVWLDMWAAEWVSPNEYTVHRTGRRFETWESNVAARLGLGVAIDYSLDVGVDAIWSRVRRLGDALRAALAELPAVMVTDTGSVRGGLVTFAHSDHPPAAVVKALAAHRPRINVTEATESGALLDMAGRGRRSVVRASVHYYNTEEEIERFAAAIASL